METQLEGEEQNQQTIGKERSKKAPDIKNIKNEDKKHDEGNSTAESNKPNGQKDDKVVDAVTDEETKSGSEEEFLMTKDQSNVEAKEVLVNYRLPLKQKRAPIPYEIVNFQNGCSSCKNLKSELSLFLAKIEKVNKKLIKFYEREKHISDELSKNKDLKAGEDSFKIHTDDDIREKKNWKALCHQYKKKYDELQQESNNKLVDFEKLFANDEEEKISLNRKLNKADKKSDFLKKSREKVHDKSSELWASINDMHNEFTGQLEKQKKELEQTSEKKIMEAKQSYYSSRTKVCQLAVMVKKASDDNTELLDQIEKTAAKVENLKSGTTETKEFYRQVEKKLSGLLKKFRDEESDPDLHWLGKNNVRYILDGFEAATKVILDKEPHLRMLIDAITKNYKNYKEQKEPSEYGTETSSIDSREARASMQKEPSESGTEKSSIDSREQKAWMDFSTTVSQEICSMLQAFQNKQKEVFCENMQSVLSHLQSVEERLDNSLEMRMNDLNKILVGIDRKQCCLQPIKKELEGFGTKLEALTESVLKFCHKVKEDNEEFDNDLMTLNAVKDKLKATSSYFGLLADEHMRLAKRVNDMETQYGKLQKDFHDSSLCDTPAMAFIGSPVTLKNEGFLSRVAENPMTRVSGSSPGVTKKDEQHIGSPGRITAQGILRDKRTSDEKTGMGAESPGSTKSPQN